MNEQNGIRRSLTAWCRFGLTCFLVVSPVACFEETPFDPALDSANDAMDEGTGSTSTGTGMGTTVGSTSVDVETGGVDASASTVSSTSSDASSSTTDVSTTASETSSATSDSEASTTTASTSTNSTGTSGPDEESSGETLSGSSTDSEGETSSTSGEDPDPDPEPDCLGDSDCQSDPALPYCEPSSGRCVECVSNAHCRDAKFPFCNPEEHACEACTELEGQCGSAACHLREGTCLPAKQVWYIDASDPTCSDTGPGTENKPFCAIGTGGSKVQASPDRSGTLHLKGAKPYTENVDLNKIGVIALLGGPQVSIHGENPKLAGISVFESVKAYLSQISVRSSGGAFYCYGGRGEKKPIIWGDRLVAKDSDEGLFFVSCSFTLSRSTIVNNSSSGIHMVNFSDLRLVNSIVGNNSSALYVGNDSSATLNYVSFAGNRGEAGNAPAIACEDNENIQIRVRNSIVLGEADQPEFVDCADVEVSYSAIANSSGITDSTNIVLSPLPALAELFVDPLALSPNFRLLKPGTMSVDRIKDVALRTSGNDPVTDIDGVRRPAVGIPDWPGADIAD